jgi:hypothetical protein
MNKKTEYQRKNGKAVYGKPSITAKTTLEEIEAAEKNQNWFINHQLDGMAKRGEISLENPPNIWAIDFGRWAVKHYGLKAYVESLRKGEYAGKEERIPERLRALKVSEEEIQALSEEVEGKAESQSKSRELKSKAMKLGNKLAAKGNDRSAAFKKAWAIVKANGIEMAVKGTSFGNRQEALKRLAAYNPAMVRAVLVPEPENKQDPAAVAVMVGVQGGKGLFRLGYIPRDMTAVAAVLGSKLPALRVVCGAWGFSNQVTFGARVALAV